MAMEDIENYVFSGSYGSFLMYGSSPAPNANIGQPEADANANAAHPQAFNMATSPAIEADQTQEPLLEPEETAAVANYGGHYINIRDLNKKITEKKRNIRREQAEVETLEEMRHQLLHGNHPNWPEQWRQRQLRMAQRKIMNQVLFLTERGIIDGYVYGMVPKGKDPIFAVSENLRAWWKEEAKFERNGPIAIFKYNTSSGPFSTNNINLNSLMEIHDATLESLASALMQLCDPPQRCYPFDNKVAPPWWPTGNEEWWGELAQLDGMSVPPYKKPHRLQKPLKVSILVAMVKHLIADNHHPLIIRGVRESTSLQKKMTAKDSMIWSAYIEHERNIYLEVNPFANMLSSENGSNTQLVPWGSGGGSISMDCGGYVNLGHNEGASAMPTFMLNQSPDQVLAQASAGNELYNIKGKTVISNDPTLYRPRQETGLFINDTSMMEGQVIPDTHTNLNPLDVADYGVGSFSNEATGCSDWLSSDKTYQQSHTDSFDWLFNF